MIQLVQGKGEHSALTMMDDYLDLSLRLSHNKPNKNICEKANPVYVFETMEGIVRLQSK